MSVQCGFSQGSVSSVQEARQYVRPRATNEPESALREAQDAFGWHILLQDRKNLPFSAVPSTQQLLEQ